MSKHLLLVPLLKICAILQSYLLVISIVWCSVGSKNNIVVTTRIDWSCVEDDRFCLRNGNSFTADGSQKQGVNWGCYKEIGTCVLRATTYEYFGFKDYSLRVAKMTMASRIDTFALPLNFCNGLFKVLIFLFKFVEPGFHLLVFVFYLVLYW